MADPLTPFDEHDGDNPWLRTSIAGNVLRAALTKIDDLSLKWKWSEDKASGSSGSKQKYGGQTKGHPTLTLEAEDRESALDILAILEAVKPEPGQGGGSAPAAAKTPAQTFSIGSPAAKGSTSAPAQPAAGGGFTVPDPNAPAASSGSGSKGPNVGPAPPVLPIENEYLKIIGITAFAAEEWNGPYWSEFGHWTVTIKIIPQDPPTPAGTGSMGAAKPASVGSGFALGSAAGPGSGGTPIQKNAAAGAAGT